VATILVTDLVGSTELRVRLGEERAEAFRRAHDRGLRAAIEGAGGSVVKGTGDGFVARFAAAHGALDAAVAAQQEADRLRRREQLPVAIRVGVAAGEVVEEDGETIGEAVRVAKRLCDVASSGQILVTDEVRLLARGRGDHTIAATGDANEVAWAPSDVGADLHSASPFVGRDDALATLREAYERALRRSGGLVLVTGDPGIGKTRLIDELISQVAAPSGATVLLGRCHDGDVTPHAAFTEAMSAWVRTAAPEAVRAALGPTAPVVARLAPAVAEVLPDVSDPLPVEPSEAAARLHDAVCQALGRMSAEAPLLMVVDDLHWADEATIGLLRAVARFAKGARVLLVATYRETDLDRRHPLAKAMPEIRREVEPVRVDLGGLATAEVEDLLVRLAGHAVADAFVNALAEETAGNPFFIRETLLHLRETGQLRQDDRRWVVGDLRELALPSGVREVVGRRLERLSPAANRLLAIGSLFEVAFPLAVAAEVAGLDEDAALDAVDEALAARILTPADDFDCYSLSHALFRHVLNEELNPSRQVRAHRAIAEALERRLQDAPTPTQAAALARHYHRSAAMPGATRGPLPATPTWSSTAPWSSPGSCSATATTPSEPGSNAT